MNFIQHSRNLLKGFAATAMGLTMAVGAFVATPAQAQIDGMALADLARHDYLSRDAVLFSQALGLDEFQRLILDSLYEDYRDRFDAGWQSTQDKIQGMVHEVADFNRDQILARIMEPFEEWRDQKLQLKRRFEDDVRAILNPQQAERWPAFVQQMTREKTMHMGQLSGENLNLFPLVRDLRLDERTMDHVQPVLDQYSEALHEALEARNSLLQNAQADFIRTMRAHGTPGAGADIEREIQARVRVRDVNLQYVDVIAQTLPEDASEQFRSRAKESANPRVFRVLPAMRMITRAAQLEDIEDSTRAAIEQLKAAFSSELEHTNSQLHAMMLDFEPRQQRNQLQMREARRTGESVSRIEDPTRQPFMEREERAQYYVEQLQALLSEEQFASLPGVERYRTARRAEAGRMGRDPRRDGAERGGRTMGGQPATPVPQPQRDGARERGESRERGGETRDRGGRSLQDRGGRGN